SAEASVRPHGNSECKAESRVQIVPQHQIEFGFESKAQEAVITMVDLAFKSLLHDKLKFAITVAGVAFAVMLVFVQVGLFMGLMDNATITIQNTSADLWVTSKNTPNIDFSHTFPEAYVDRVRTVPGVERAD